MYQYYFQRNLVNQPPNPNNGDLDMASIRTYFATQAIALKADGDTEWVSLHGVQSFSKTVSFSLEQAYELGKLPIYANVEGVPNIECQMSKVLDGYPLIWTLSSRTATKPDLSNRGNTKCLIGLSVYEDTSIESTGIGVSEAEISGAFVTALSYTFPVEGFFTESVTFQGSDIVWSPDARRIQTVDIWTGADDIDIDQDIVADDSPIGSGGVNRRRNFLWTATDQGLDVNGQTKDVDASTLPSDITGISSSGTNNIVNGVYSCSVQNISVNANITRDDIFQLGRHTFFHRTIKFPIEVTTEIGVIVGSGDLISATNRGIFTPDSATQCDNNANLSEKTIRLSTCEGTRIYLGTKNKLSNVSYSGGDANGGNVICTYSYLTFNDFTVVHSTDEMLNINDTAVSESWWDDRQTLTYLHGV